MPGIYKVGMTTRDPTARLAEANRSDTWRPPTEYDLKYSVRVRDALETERKLHTMLAENWERIHPRREFFKAELRVIKVLMDHVRDDDVVVVDTDEEEAEAETDAEIYYHPSVMPKKAKEPAGAAAHKHLRSGRVVEPGASPRVVILSRKERIAAKHAAEDAWHREWAKTISW